VLIDRAPEEGPAAGDLDVSLIDEPPVTGGVSRRSGCVDEPRRERLDPAVDPQVINLDAALGQQFFDIAVGQPLA